MDFVSRYTVHELYHMSGKERKRNTVYMSKYE
jgi:hypothetical protein